MRDGTDGRLEGGMMSVQAPSPETPDLTVIHGPSGLRQRAGSSLGVSRWVTIDQLMVTAFAELSGDRQWIHVDPERAAQGPYGTTIAHGFLTLSLSTGLLDQIFTVDDVGVFINYGLNRVRFPAPMPAGSRVRMHVSLAEAVDIPDGVQVVYHLEYEVEGQAKPCCVADLIFRYYAK
jgi:acyl dehydratase